MNLQGFRKALKERKLPEDKIETSLVLAERFETFLTGKPADAGTAWAFSEILIREGQVTEEYYLALARYCLFIKNYVMYVALLELLDSREVSGNLYRRVGERFGTEIRDEVFTGIGIAPCWTPSPEKPAYIHPVIERLKTKVGEDACKDFLSDSLRDLPDEYFSDEYMKYCRAGNIDSYLAQRKEAFVAQLETCLREDRPFFAQMITQEVVDYVKDTPEIGGGRRDGGIVYEVKIPYMTHEYLAEQDPILRRYYSCHCPWAREAIRNNSVKLAPVFCNCSAGFHKKPFEAAFGQPVKVDVLESALMGHDRCRFAIHLPQGVVP